MLCQREKDKKKVFEPKSFIKGKNESKEQELTRHAAAAATAVIHVIGWSRSHQCSKKIGMLSFYQCNNQRTKPMHGIY